MFYVFNVSEWLQEVLAACNREGLDPEEAIFVLVLFSSLDFPFVEFFRNRKSQLSQYTGENVHLFTPTVFDGVVPDSEWRMLRSDFERSGIPVGNRPASVFFRLHKRASATGYEPEFFAAFKCPDFSTFEYSIRDIVDACLRHRDDQSSLLRELAAAFQGHNLIHRGVPAQPESLWPVDQVLKAPRVFVSYSHADKTLADQIVTRLQSDNVRFWLDRRELSPGIRFQEAIESAIRDSDAVLVLLSERSIESKWVPFETSLFYAQHPRKLMIPIALDSAGRDAASRMPHLMDRHIVDLSDRALFDARIKSLEDALKSLAGSA